MDRNRHGGGVLVYLIMSLSFNIVFSGSNDLELLVLSVSVSSSVITLCTFYRPPSTPSIIFDTLLNTICMHVNVSLLSNLVLLGDFNVNILDPDHPLFSCLLSMSSSLCLTQVVSEPTRVLSNSHSLIDLVFLSDPSHLTGCVTIPALSNSDHLGLSVSISAGNPGSLPKRKSRSIWRYSHANFDRACELLDSTDWDSIFATNDVSSCWANWHSHFLKIMEKCIPKVVLRSRPNLPWLTKTVTQAIRRRNFLFRAAKHSKSLASYQRYRAARNRVTALLRLNKSNYFKKFAKQRIKRILEGH